MCGITGFFLFQEPDSSGALSAALKGMVGSITHRGPDSEGFFERGRVGLGIRRLRVIDLITGDQPISNEARSCWIVFNGEIYNYRTLRNELQKRGHSFHTETDTEVILRLYEEKGPECVRDLNGMYAFAIYDDREKSLFLARDPLGIKPLFYYQDSEKLVFGSEIKALLAFPGIDRILDLEAASHFLSLNYLPSPWTLFCGIRQLEGGRSLFLKHGKTTLQRFWNPVLNPDFALSEEEAVKKTKTLLRQAIQNQLVADVSVGAFLSGGLDSSALVALAKEARQGPLETFSVGFDDPSYDETPYAREVANYFGTSHHEIRMSSANLPQLLPRMISQLDQPLGDPAAAALYVVSRLAREFVTVSLAGDGSDEIFVGYPTYHANRYLQWYCLLPRFLKERVVEPLVFQLPSSTEKFSFDYRARKFLEGARFERRKAHFWWRTVFSDIEKERIFRSPFREAIRNLESYSVYKSQFDNLKNLDFTSQCLYADLRVWLAGNNLHKVDSMSMAHSLEARVPYLDQALVEFLMRVPPALKFKHSRGKYLLKKAMKGLLPEEVIHRKKSGWHLPFARWFRYDLKEYLTDRFTNGAGPFFDLFDKEEILRILDKHSRGEGNHSFKIWGLLVLQEWFRIYEPRVEAGLLLKARE